MKQEIHPGCHCGFTAQFQSPPSLFFRLVAWANSWSTSQLVLLFTMVGACLVVVIYQYFVIRHLAEQLKGLTQ